MRRLFIVLFVATLFFITGCQGVSVVDANVNENGELVLFLSDGSSINAGVVKGEDGKDGRDGADGKDGLNGMDGKDGADGVGIAKAAVNDSGNLMIRLTDDTLINAGEVKGEDGSDGADGRNGHDGSDGTDGKDGIDGADGKDGRDGIDGKDGKDGRDGIDGKDGKDGRDGIDGKDGKDGRDGIDGKDGKDGADATPVSQPNNNDPQLLAPAYEPAPVTAHEGESNSPFAIDNTGTITGYSGTAESIEIPVEASAIGDEAFKDNPYIRSVSIPKSVVSIGNSAFKGCTSLESVTFSNESALNSIGDSAFEDCTKLDYAAIPDAVSRIGDSAFKNSGLSGTLTFYSDVGIGQSAFEKTGIDNIILHESSKIELTAEPYAFASCPSITITLENQSSKLILKNNSFLGVNKLTVNTSSTTYSRFCKLQYTMEKLGLKEEPSFNVLQ